MPVADPMTPRPPATARPSDAERAATALAGAGAATVTTYSRDPSARTRQTVTRIETEDGRIVFWLEARSWAVANLCARPVAQLAVADPRSRSAVVLLRGGVRRISGARAGRLRLGAAS